MSSIFDKLGTIPYYYVSLCPYCGSKATGRLIEGTDKDESYLVRDALRHGEIVSVVDGVYGNNCFCMDCGTTWQEDVKLDMISKERLSMERRDRHTSEILKEMDEDDENAQKKKRSVFKRYFGIK